MVCVVGAADFTRSFSVPTFSSFQCQVIWHDLQLESSKSIQPPLGSSAFILVYNQRQLDRRKPGCNQIHKLPFHSPTVCVCFCLYWIEESWCVLLEYSSMVGWWAVTFCDDPIPSQVCSTSISVKQIGDFRKEGLEAAVASTFTRDCRWVIKNLTTSGIKGEAQIWEIRQRFSNGLIMTTTCGSPFRLPYCDDYPERRQNLGEGKFSSCFTKVVKINPKLEPVMLELHPRHELKAVSSSATIWSRSWSGGFRDDVPLYVGSVLRHSQTPRRTYLNSHDASRCGGDYSSLPFQRTSFCYSILHTLQLTERGGEHSPVLVFWSPSEVFGEMGNFEQKALVPENSSSAKRCRKPNGEDACSASEQI